MCGIPLAESFSPICSLNNWNQHNWGNEMKLFNRKAKMDKRVYPRKPYSGDVFFVANNGFNEGRLKDLSRSGLFINSKARLPVGEIITMALPFLNGKNDKCKGQIMRSDKQGFAIEFFRDRSFSKVIVKRRGIDI